MFEKYRQILSECFGASAVCLTWQDSTFCPQLWQKCRHTRSSTQSLTLVSVVAFETYGNRVRMFLSQLQPFFRIILPNCAAYNYIFEIVRECRVLMPRPASTIAHAEHQHVSNGRLGRLLSRRILLRTASGL